MSYDSIKSMTVNVNLACRHFYWILLEGPFHRYDESSAELAIGGKAFLSYGAFK